MGAIHMIKENRKNVNIENVVEWQFGNAVRELKTSPFRALLGSSLQRSSFYIPGFLPEPIRKP